MTDDELCTYAIPVWEAPSGHGGPSGVGLPVGWWPQKSKENLRLALEVDAWARHQRSFEDYAPDAVNAALDAYREAKETP